jgi:hypothetical protein
MGISNKYIYHIIQRGGRSSTILHFIEWTDMWSMDWKKRRSYRRRNLGGWLVGGRRDFGSMQSTLDTGWHCAVPCRIFWWNMGGGKDLLLVRWVFHMLWSGVCTCSLKGWDSWQCLELHVFFICAGIGSFTCDGGVQVVCHRWMLLSPSGLQKKIFSG